MPARCINTKFYALCKKERDAARVEDAPVIFIAACTSLSRFSISNYLRDRKSIYVETRLARVFRMTRTAFRRAIGFPARKLDALGRKYIHRKPRKQARTIHHQGKQPLTYIEWLSKHKP